MMDQYGPSAASVDSGSDPSAKDWVGSFLDVAGWLCGE
jgi:hypothetical protein